jgi:hypothetical protein
MPDGCSPVVAWGRGRLARMELRTRSSCPWARGRLARMDPRARASCPWGRGRLARLDPRARTSCPWGRGSLRLLARSPLAHSLPERGFLCLPSEMDRGAPCSGVMPERLLPRPLSMPASPASSRASREYRGRAGISVTAPVAVCESLPGAANQAGTEGTALPALLRAQLGRCSLHPDVPRLRLGADPQTARLTMPRPAWNQIASDDVRSLRRQRGGDGGLALPGPLSGPDKLTNSPPHHPPTHQLTTPTVPTPGGTPAG